MSRIAEIASAFLTLAPSAAGFGKKLDSQISGDINSSGKKSGLSFGKLFAIGAGLGIGAKAFSFLGDSLSEGREAQKVSALVSNAIKATGGAANVTAGQVDRLATSISKKTGIDDEQIATASSLILTFKNVANEAGKGNDIFNKTTKAAVDLSAAGFGSVDSAAKQLGKALNDPLKGMSALSRSGVTFSDSQQKQIKGFVETGNLLKAQKLILAEVNSQVGGAAAATATASDKAAVAAGNLKEQVGTALIPVVDSLASKFTTSVAPAISGFITGMQTGIGAGGQFASVVGTIASNFGTIAPVLGIVLTGLLAYRVASAAAAAISVIQAAGTTAATGATWSLNAALRANPIGLVVTAVTLLVAGLVIAYKKSDTFRGIVNGLWSSLKTAGSWLGSMTAKGLQLAQAIGAKVLPPVLKFAAFLGGVYVAHVRAAIAVIGAIIGKVVAFGSALVGGVQAAGKFLSGVKDKIGAALSFIGEIPGKIKGFFSNAGTLLSSIGGQIVGGLKTGIENAWHFVTDIVTNLINKIPKAIRKIMGIASPSKVTTVIGGQIVRGLSNGIKNNVDGPAKALGKAGKKLKEKLEGVRDDLRSTLDGLKGDFKSLADSIAGAFTGNLFEATTGADFIANLMGKKGELAGLLASFKTLKGWGLDPAFLTQLFASGNGALIADLAGMGKAGAVEAGSLFGDVTSLSSQLGNAVAKNDPVSDRIDITNQKLDEVIKQLGGVGKDFGDSINSVSKKASQKKKKKGR